MQGKHLHTMTLTRIPEKMRKFNINLPLTDRFLVDVARVLEPVSFPKGAVMFHQGDPADCMYLIDSGKLEVSVKTANDSHLVVGTLGEGELVGEMALVVDLRRSATVTVLEDCELLRLSKVDFDTLTTKHPALLKEFGHYIKPRLQGDRLASIVTGLFGHMELDTFQDFSNRLEWVCLDAGEVLFREGEEGDAMYIVVNGRLGVAPNDDFSNENLLGEVRPGESIGEFSVFTKERRNSTVFAIRDSNIVKLNAKNFFELSETHPRTMFSITRSMIQRYQRGSGNHFDQGRQGMNLTLIYIGDLGRDIHFAELLENGLSEYGKTLHLSSARFDQQFGKRGAAQTPTDHAADIAIISWLNDREAEYDYVIYEVDREDTDWTKRSIRQADRILIVADSTQSPELSEIEQAVQRINPRARQELILLHQKLVYGHPSGTHAWLDARNVKTHHHIRLRERADYKRLARRLSNNGAGLVLSGGGARGLAHVGVVRALMEAGIDVDFIGGTSMGALLGGVFATGRSYEEVLELVARYSSPRLLMDYTLPTTSLVKTGKVTEILQEMYGELRIEDLMMPFFCISTNLTRAKAVVHQRGLLWEAVRASIAIPAIFSPFCAEGDVLVDGGVMNNLPIDVMHGISENGPLIAVNASPEMDMNQNYRFSSSLSGWKSLLDKFNPFSSGEKAPQIMNIMMRTIEVNTVSHLEDSKDLTDIFIQPPIHEFSIRDFDAYERIIEVGYEEAKRCIEAWQKDQHRRK